MILRRSNPTAWVDPHRVPQRKPARPKVICHDCGSECRREDTGFSCDCGFGFVVGWDTCVGFGIYLGRIEIPEREEVAA